MRPQVNLLAAFAAFLFICSDASAQGACTAQLISSTPENGFIDPRTHSINGGAAGISEITLTFDQAETVSRDCISVSETGGGAAPGFSLVNEGVSVRVILDRPITSNQWTTITYHEAEPGKAHHIDIAQLFGDYTRDRYVDYSDFSYFVACFDGVAPCPQELMDNDRNGQLTSGDVLMLVNANDNVGAYLPVKPHDPTDVKLKTVCSANDALIRKALKGMAAAQLKKVSPEGSKVIVAVKRLNAAKAEPSSRFASQVLSPMKITANEQTRELNIEAAALSAMSCRRENTYRISTVVLKDGEVQSQKAYEVTLTVPGMYQ